MSWPTGACTCLAKQKCYLCNKEYYRQHLLNQLEFVLNELKADPDLTALRALLDIGVPKR